MTFCTYEKAVVQWAAAFITLNNTKGDNMRCNLTMDGQNMK